MDTSFRQKYNHEHQFEDARSLKLTILKTWDEISSQTLRNLVDSMKDRMLELVNKMGIVLNTKIRHCCGTLICRIFLASLFFASCTTCPINYSRDWVYVCKVPVNCVNFILSYTRKHRVSYLFGQYLYM